MLQAYATCGLSAVRKCFKRDTTEPSRSASAHKPPAYLCPPKRPLLNHYGILCYGILCYGILCYGILCFGILCYGILCYGILCYGILCYAILCYGILCYGILCYAILCYGILCYGILCYGILCYGILCRMQENTKSSHLQHLDHLHPLREGECEHVKAFDHVFPNAKRRSHAVHGAPHEA